MLADMAIPIPPALGSLYENLPLVRMTLNSCLFFLFPCTLVLLQENVSLASKFQLLFIILKISELVKTAFLAISSKFVILDLVKAKSDKRPF